VLEPEPVALPVNESLAKRPCFAEGAEAIGKGPTVLEGTKLAFEEEVVVGDVWSAVGLGDAKVSGK